MAHLLHHASLDPSPMDKVTMPLNLRFVPVNKGVLTSGEVNKNTKISFIDRLTSRQLFWHFKYMAGLPHHSYIQSPLKNKKIQ